MASKNKKHNKSVRDTRSSRQRGFDNIAATKHAGLMQRNTEVKITTEEQPIALESVSVHEVEITIDVEEAPIVEGFLTPEFTPRKLSPLGESELQLKQSIIYDVAHGISAEGKRARAGEIYDAIGADHFHDATLQGIKGWEASLGFSSSKEKA